MSKRVLIVEDEELIAKSISFALRREGFETEVAADGESARASIAAHPPDAVILDIVLPGELTGFDVCRTVRAGGLTPILMLSARGTETDKVLGLERGADDYMTKPFSMQELVARVRAHLRRIDFHRLQSTDAARQVGDIKIDLVRREVEVEGERVHLTVSEFALLARLSETPDHPVTRAALMSSLWSTDAAISTRTCDAHIRRLRRQTERDPSNPRRVVTVRGVGYMLVADA